MPDPTKPDEGLDINLSASFPFEGLITAAIKAWSQARSEMDDEVRKRWDVIGVEMVEYAWGQAKKVLQVKPNG